MREARALVSSAALVANVRYWSALAVRAPVTSLTCGCVCERNALRWLRYPAVSHHSYPRGPAHSATLPPNCNPTTAAKAAAVSAKPSRSAIAFRGIATCVVEADHTRLRSGPYEELAAGPILSDVGELVRRLPWQIVALHRRRKQRGP